MDEERHGWPQMMWFQKLTLSSLNRTIQWLVHITFHFIKVVTSSLGNDSSSKTYVWVYKLSMFHLHLIHNFLLVNLHPFIHLYHAFIHFDTFIFTISQKTKKRTTIWRWRHVISETKRFAPLVINLKNYNLLLILSQVLFSFGWKLKTPNFHIFHIFPHPSLFCNIFLFLQVLFNILPMMTTFMHHSYSNDDSRHHFLIRRQKSMK